MPIRKQIVADDGIHQVVRTSVSLPRADRPSKADMNAVRALLTEAGLAATFEGAIGAAEKYWQSVPADQNAQPLSKPWYAARILNEIESLREFVAVPNPGKPTLSLEFRIVSAMNLGARIEEAKWRFGLGNETRLGAKTYQNLHRMSKQSVQVRADNKTRDDGPLLAAVRDYRSKHPTHSRRTMADNLFPGFGRDGDSRKAIHALAKRIGRLEK